MQNTSFSQIDHHWMNHAIDLASKGIYSTTPNPRVGAVILAANGELVGEGYHLKAGQGHAEVYALRQAGSKAKNGTCYVTLEPCSHTGKTPPCADALIEAGVSRVVIANVDPNPLVNHAGVDKLKQAGIEVSAGLEATRAADLNKAFFFRMQHKTPWLTVKLAASMDGKTALSNGQSKWITSEKARQDVQAFRAQYCAILSGADTVLADNPQLNVRANLLSQSAQQGFLSRAKQPLRVIIDSQNRLSNNYQLFNDGNPVVVFNHQHNPKLTQIHTTQIQVGMVGKFLNLSEVFEKLAILEVNSVWVEAGATLTGALFDQQWVNELVLYQAPVILGANAKSLTNTRDLDSISDAIDLKLIDCVQIGIDLRHRFHLLNHRNL